MNNEKKNTAKKSLWGYGIVAVYTAFALGTLGVVAFTMTQKVELVSNDYYATELKYEQQISRQREGNTLEQKITCQTSTDGQLIQIRFPQQFSEAKGTILLYRPAASEMDQEVKLQLDNEGVQNIPAAKLAKGLWQVKLTWSYDGRDYYNEFRVRL